MLRFGNIPYLECSSKGDKRFSAFYAKIKKFGNRSIEDIYQCNKIVNGVKCKNWKEGKGKKADNADELSKLYFKLWIIYFKENPELYNYIKKYNGFSDIFGKIGCNCQAEVIYKIRFGNFI